MDIIRFKGGLGNQMFQYAFLKSLMQRGRDVRGNLGFYRLHPDLMHFCLTDVFSNIDIQFIEDNIFNKIDKRWKRIKEQEDILKEFLFNYSERFFWVEDSKFYDEHVFETRNCVFVGYWQTEKYFKHIRSELLNDFSFHPGDTKFEKMKIELKGHKDYVSIHIRRCDYLKNPEIYGDLSATNYYYNAKKYISTRVNNPIYVYFSDDIQWVKENFKDKNGIYIEENLFDDYQVWYDMCLMSCCANNIIANSSFSWWAAWLNQNENKNIISPEPWFLNCDMSDIYCEKWIKIPING